MSDDSAQKPGPNPLPPPWDRIFALGTRVFVWGVLFGLLWVLRPFFLLVFLTFVFAYILEHSVQGLKHRMRNRPARVVLVSGVFVTTIVAVGVLLAPAFERQAHKIWAEFPLYLAKIDAQIDGLRQSQDWAKELIPPDVNSAAILEHIAGIVQREKPDAPRLPINLDPELIGPPAPPVPLAPDTVVPAAPNRSEVNQALDFAVGIASPILGVTSSILLALLFSFLIVLDLPRLSRSVRGLRSTRIGFIYEEVAENIHDLGLMLGRALEAQFIIAICNTILTAIGLWILGLTANLVFQSTVVFLFSFIPVVGVFISSTPICLEALSAEGFPLALGAALMITIIHMIEAYILNPRIFGHHLRMNPVMVLIVLTVGGKLFGLWGFILGLPVTNYIFAHAIRHKRSEPHPAGLAA